MQVRSSVRAGLQSESRWRSQVELRLADSSDTRALWPHAFELTYTLTLKPHCLELELKSVPRTCTQPLPNRALAQGCQYR